MQSDFDSGLGVGFVLCGLLFTVPLVMYNIKVERSGSRSEVGMAMFEVLIDARNRSQGDQFLPVKVDVITAARLLGPVVDQRDPVKAINSSELIQLSFKTKFGTLVVGTNYIYVK